MLHSKQFVFFFCLVFSKIPSVLLTVPLLKMVPFCFRNFVKELLFGKSVRIIKFCLVSLLKKAQMFDIIRPIAIAAEFQSAEIFTRCIQPSEYTLPLLKLPKASVQILSHAKYTMDGTSCVRNMKKIRSISNIAFPLTNVFR